jgi:hypothetical protein
MWSAGKMSGRTVQFESVLFTLAFHYLDSLVASNAL